MRTFIFVTSLLFSFEVFSSHKCTGLVKSIDITGSAQVLTSLEGMGVGNVVCSLSQTLGLYGPEACEAALSLLLTAKASGKEISIWFNDDTNTSCDKGNWQNYSTYGLYHLRIEE